MSWNIARKIDSMPEICHTMSQEKISVLFLLESDNSEENLKSIQVSVGRFDRQVQCLISSWQFPSRLEPPPRRRSGVSRQTWETAIKDLDSARPHKKWSQNCMSCLQ